MAHFRRRRPRGKTTGNTPTGTYWLHTWPSWWDHLYLRRPARRRGKEITHKVLRGEVDPDNAVWDVHRTRPHNYYW